MLYIITVFHKDSKVPELELKSTSKETADYMFSRMKSLYKPSKGYSVTIEEVKL